MSSCAISEQPQRENNGTHVYNTPSYYLEKEKIKDLPVRLREVPYVNNLLSKHGENRLS